MATPSPTDQAIARFEGFLKVDPTNALIWVELGDLYHRSGRFEEAIACYEKSQLNNGNPAITQGRIASVMISQHRFADAEKNLRALIKDGKSEPELLYNLGLSVFYQKRWTEAQQCFEGAKLAGLNTHGVLDYLARSLHQQGRLDDAIATCRQRLALENDVAGEGYLALLQMDAGNMVEALSLAERVLARDPDNVDAAAVVGGSSIERQQMDVAEKLFNGMVQRQPDNVRGWIGMGLVHMYRQQYPDAVAAFERTLEIAPEQVGIMVTLGWAEIAAAKVMEAERRFRAAIDIDRNFGEAHGGLAVALALQHRVEEANQAVRRATGLNPHGFGAAFARALLLKLQGRDKLAVELTARLLQQAPPGGRPLIEYIQEFARQQQAR